MKSIIWSVLIIFVLIFGIAIVSNTQAEEEEVTYNLPLEPVEADMHEFMEYAFEPFFHELKESMAEAPADKKSWVPVKAHSLILAEAGNLLMLRGPDENKAEWNQLAKELRDQGKLLYAAAKKRDYDSSRKQYEAFVTKCNACHEKFAEGEHIQKP